MRRVVLAVLAVLATAAPAQAAGELQLVGSTRISDRLSELAFRTPAVDRRDARARAHAGGLRRVGQDALPGALPAARRARRRHGWTTKGDAEAITAGVPLIVVMPSSGTGGGYVDWRNGGAVGPPAWETYHLVQLAALDRRALPDDRHAARAAPSPACRWAATGRCTTPRGTPTCSSAARASPPPSTSPSSALRLVSTAVDLIDGQPAARPTAATRSTCAGTTPSTSRATSPACR